MFATDVTLAGTSVSRTYSLTSIANGKSIRADATAASGQPRTFVISHAPSVTSGVTVDRHLVRFDDTIAGVSPAPDATPTVQLVIGMPRVTATVAQVKDIIDRLKAFLAVGANIDKLLNNEP
jgi:hypothetical protein